jgi:hypothetical protein
MYHISVTMWNRCRRGKFVNYIMFYIVEEMEEAVNQLILQLGGKVVAISGTVRAKRNKKLGRLAHTWGGRAT